MSGDQDRSELGHRLEDRADNDYTVCTTWLQRGKDLYLLHVVRERLEYPDLLRRVGAHWKAISRLARS
jgi:phage terminase large subunit-like protein